MATLKCIGMAGLKLWFWSNDHDQPHFHAKRAGAWEYKIYFQRDEANMFEMKWAKSKKTIMSRQDKKQIVKMVVANRDSILNEWEEIHP